jgi:hypothetical protein
LPELPAPAPVTGETDINQLPQLPELPAPAPLTPETDITQLPELPVGGSPAPVTAEIAITQLPELPVGGSPAPLTPETDITQLPELPAPAPVTGETDINQLPELPELPAPTIIENRVNSLAQLASEATAPTIPQLQNPSQTLSQQWQGLADLSKTQLKLTDLEPSVAQKIYQAFQKYHEASNLAAIATELSQHPPESFAPAVSHSQIEQQRLESLQGVQKELNRLLAELEAHKTALDSEMQKVWNEMEQHLPLAELNWIQANISLLPVFSSGDDSLYPLTALWPNAVAHQSQRLQICRQNAQLFEAQRQEYAALATGINTNRWQIIGYQRNACGRQGEIWSLVTDSHRLALKNQYLSQSAIAAQNRQALETLARAIQQSATLLWDAEFMENTRNSQEMVRQAAGVTLALVQPQQTESLNPQKAPEQSQLQVAGATAQDCKEIQFEVISIQAMPAAKPRDWQTARFLLLYRQQLTARKVIQQLEYAKIEVDIAMQQAGRG